MRFRQELQQAKTEHIDSLVTISTCNRTEIYGFAHVITSYSIHYTKLYEVYLPSGDEDGVEMAELFSFTINTNSLALLEVKYSISFEVFENLAEDVLTDKAARRVNTYFMLDGLTRQFSYNFV